MSFKLLIPSNLWKCEFLVSHFLSYLLIMLADKHILFFVIHIGVIPIFHFCPVECVPYSQLAFLACCFFLPLLPRVLFLLLLRMRFPSQSFLCFLFLLDARWTSQIRMLKYLVTYASLGP